jgi:hypothetical protein
MNDAKSQVEYFESKKSFNKELVKHFPNKLTNNFLESRYSGNELYLKNLIKSDDKYRTLKKQLIKNVKIIKKSTDSCFQIITVKVNQKTPIIKNLLPIPKEIISEFTSKNEKRKMLNNEIAFIDFKLKTSEKDRSRLPRKWKNGYSKGYAFDDIEQTITYWLIIW